MATKLKPAASKPGTNEIIPAQRVTREIGKYLVTLTVDGLVIREKGRRLDVGPLSYEILYNDSLQRQAGLMPIKARSGSAKRVSRGLLSTSAGK
jgi:hypothetical protein